MEVESKLAIFGGPKSVHSDPRDIFTWPIITKEDEDAILDVLRKRSMSGTNITRELEKEYAAWQGSEYALGFSTGTGALEAAMFGCKVGVGDEIISPSFTYWATCLPAYNLGATVVFAEVDPDTLCLDPNDIEHRITEHTKAIIPVHYVGYPADMDAIMEIAERHNVKVIEDVSHAHGGFSNGKKVGSAGHVGAMSMMSGKALAVGEAGMLVTDDREIHDRAIAWAHYARFNLKNIETEYLKYSMGMPLGGHKYRMHQMSAAVARVQLKYYDERSAEIDKCMNYFWDLLDGVPGIKPHRPPKDSKDKMGGWYSALGVYKPEEVEGLSVTRFCEACRAEGVEIHPGANRPLHLHPVFNDVDIYGHGKPTRIANSDRDLRQPLGSLPVTESVSSRCFTIPWFKKYYPEVIEEQAAGMRKAAENYKELLAEDPGNKSETGGWNLYRPAE